MRFTAWRVVVLAMAAALLVFCVVQDRLTAEGARAFVRQQRAAIGRGETGETIDAVMRPALRRAVRTAAGAGGLVLLAGAGGAALIARRSRRA